MSVSVSVKHGGRSWDLRVTACRIALGGEFAGNVDLDVRCDPGAVDPLHEHLGVRLPEGAPSGPALGSSSHEAGVLLGFWIEQVLSLQTTPEAVELLWKVESVGRITPSLHESRPVGGAVCLRDPVGLAPPPSVHHGTRLVRLAANRERWWYALVAVAVGIAALGAAALPAFDLPDPKPAAGAAGALFAIVAAWGVYLARVPYRQVWLDRDRRRVFVLERRTRDPEAALASVAGRELDQFEHVRLYMRWQISSSVEDVDQEVWTVTLEGPIRHAGTDGRVHLRPDAFSSRRRGAGPLRFGLRRRSLTRPT